MKEPIYLQQASDDVSIILEEFPLLKQVWEESHADAGGFKMWSGIYFLRIEEQCGVTHTVHTVHMLARTLTLTQDLGQAQKVLENKRDSQRWGLEERVQTQTMKTSQKLVV